ncbi:MAG TPA: prepilin-type N-terminal cleavage/methylation domain-containing protein [Patescibacteria group bacterium]|nr:prepilin-type N-terminal cleavage/methylation domain-containing protein [Patescibacteria group bacterium]
MNLKNSTTSIPIRSNTDPKCRNVQAGMSLIEVVVSLFLVLVLLLVYVAALNTVALVKRNNYSDLAFRVASKQMETLRGTPFGSLGDTSGTAISDAMLSQIPSGAGTYAISDDPDMDGVKDITVTVTWNDGKDKSAVLQTRAASGGLNP